MKAIKVGGVDPKDLSIREALATLPKGNPTKAFIEKAIQEGVIPIPTIKYTYPIDHRFRCSPTKL